MKHFLHALTLAAAAAIASPALANIELPPTPQNIRVPAGHSVYLKTRAVGTQNYVCGQGAAGPAWQFIGPQATLFIPIPWIQGPVDWQIATHFLSSNPSESGAARPAWQSSSDSSVIWGKALASSTDPTHVAAGAIPWLLVEITGSQRGPANGAALARTTFIQRLNTSGGIAPTSGCDTPAYGKIALVPYTTDYFFFQPDTRN